MGPTQIAFANKREAYVVLPKQPQQPSRLIVGLHGVCNPPGYACGHWQQAASGRGLLICPEGNARCGAAEYHAPTWTQPATAIDDDLEAAVEAVRQRYPKLVASNEERTGAVLMGFSRGAYAAVKIARARPGRWPHLLLVEAKVSLAVPTLRRAGVRSVALVAGERSGQRGSMQRTAQALAAADYPAKLWLMPKAGHHYSGDIDTIMADALDFLTARQDAPPSEPDAGRGSP